MWNPKRLLILFLSFLVFFASYQVYANFLGGIDGLPPLPGEFWPTPVETTEVKPPLNPLVDHKLAMAFGERSPVMNQLIKLEVSSRGMVLATDEFTLVDGGRIKLQPFRVALFGKNLGEHGTPEINTVSSDVAYLTFDEPISAITEIGSRKIVATQLEGNVLLVNNRRTLPQDDDLSLFTQGPVYYQADQNLIWTDQVIKVTDLQSKPQPTTINAMGMDVYLIAENVPAQPGVRKAKTDSITGVDKVHLRQNVEMYLYVDSTSGFMASGKPEPKKEGMNKAGPSAKPTPPTDKSKVVIRTEGPFEYEIAKDRARFDISQRPSLLPQEVNITREHQENQFDHLICDHLELQFRRKNTQSPGTTAAGDDNHEVALEIESAHATAERGKEVIISSDVENLDAFGKDLYYDAQTKTTILKGEGSPKFPFEGPSRPMKAVKELNVIYARELQMVELPQGQQTTALGPGKIDLYDKKTKKYPLHAQWADQLVSCKEGVFDTMTLTGDAVFQDDGQGQQLRGDSLKVWLQTDDQAKSGSEAQQRLKPHQLEAKGHVTAKSSDLHIKEPTEHLVLWFKDVAKPLPGIPPTGGPPPVGETVKPQAVVDGTPGKPEGQVKATAPVSLTNPAPGASKKPITLSATSIEAHLLRSDAKTDLDRLWCEGSVRVLQDPVSPEDKGTDIHGETLQLTHFLEGDVLVVTGTLAQVQMNKTTILGPEIIMDQKTNVAEVHGVGVMKMPASSSINDGHALEKPSEVTIVWKDSMFFDGKVAEFHGDVQGKQDTSRLLCQDMVVYLDRAVSFKEGAKGQDAAKIQRVLCDKKVYLEDKTVKGPQLEAYRRITAPYLALSNEEGKAMAPGPGMVHILQMGSPDNGLPGETPSPAVKSGNAPNKSTAKLEELQLTRINYRDRLYGNNNSRTAIFYGDVKLVHLPASNPDLKIDLDHPPEGLLYLTCEQLKVFTDATKHQQLEAQTRVVVQSKEFWGTAEVVKYDEAKELVIFEGTQGNPANLYRSKVSGAPQEKITGKKIYYWRRTNDFKIEEAEGANISP